MFFFHMLQAAFPMPRWLSHTRDEIRESLNSLSSLFAGSFTSLKSLILRLPSFHSGFPWLAACSYKSTEGNWAIFLAEAHRENFYVELSNR